MIYLITCTFKINSIYLKELEEGMQNVRGCLREWNENVFFSFQCLQFFHTIRKYCEISDLLLHQGGFPECEQF